MSNLLEYKNYFGTVEYSSSDKILYGKVIGINGLISYEGSSIESLQADFEAAVDDYLEMCREQGIEPQKTYKGSFNVRISPALHKNLALFAAAHNKTLNAAVEDAIKAYVG
jgi:predicted HicB family RNase H-like nuclease